MTEIKITRALVLGVQRRGWMGFRNGLAAVGAVWTATELATAAKPAWQLALEGHGALYLWLVAILFVIFFFAYVYEPKSVRFNVPGSDTKITLKFGDLFQEDANILVGVNEFFDGELGQPVSKHTVHGQLIVRNFGGSAANFRASVDPALEASRVRSRLTRRDTEPSRAYPIGTTVSIPNGQRVVFLMAMAHTDLATSKASSDVPTLWTAMRSGLQFAYAHGNGEPLAMPLIGNGQSGVKLEPQHLLRLIILSLVDFATNSSARLPKNVTIVLHHDCFNELDIREIARDWERA